MKWTIKMVILLSIITLTVGCDNQTSKKSNEQNSSAQSKNSSKISETNQKTVSTSSQTNGSSETSEIVSGKNSEKVITDKLANIFSGEKLPNLIYGPTNRYLTATYTTPKSKDYQINYFFTDQQLALNDASLNSMATAASFQKQEFATSQEAINAVGYLAADGIAVNLNHGITGYQQGAAGSTYLAWQEGNWSLVVQTTNSTAEDPIAVANSVIDLLESIYLPAPTNVGQITIHLHSSNQLVFNQDNIVYTLTHSDYLALLRMAASMQ